MPGLAQSPDVPPRGRRATSRGPLSFTARRAARAPPALRDAADLVRRGLEHVATLDRRPRARPPGDGRAPTDTRRASVESFQPYGSYRTSDLNHFQAHDPDTLLALQVNGEPLALDHGYPLRLIAPNRPGVMQTKWIKTLIVEREPRRRPNRSASRSVSCSASR